MSRELTYEGVILKKQAFGEADEIITFFTKQSGKLRALAKSVKLPVSKLQYSLQPMFVVSVTVTKNGNLPKVINAQPLESFTVLHDHPESLAVWFVVAELLLKALPDEEKNESVYDLVKAYLQFLNTGRGPGELSLSLLKFKTALFTHIGLDIHSPASPGFPLLFSASRGGFYSGSPSADSRPVPPEVWESFRVLRNVNFPDIPAWSPAFEQLDHLVTSFITYQLEREIRAEQFLPASPSML